MEILDSRFVGFKYFSLPDVVADNSSSWMFVMDEQGVSPATLTVEALATIELDMRVNGVTAQKASAAEISGNPLMSIVQLCQILHQRGKTLPAGSIVLAGAATQAVQLEKGMHVSLAAGRGYDTCRGTCVRVPWNANTLAIHRHDQIPITVVSDRPYHCGV